MKKIIFKEDIHFMYISTRSFPEDIFKVHQDLNSRIGSKEGRYYFGISFVDGTGKIQYKAAVIEKFEGEDATLNLKTASLKKGEYHCITFPDDRENNAENGEAFKVLILNPKTDIKLAATIPEHSFL